MDETVAYVRAAAPKLPHAVVEQIFTYPYCRIGNLVEQGIAGREAASKYLRDLARLGILEEEKVGRDKIFLHRKYIDVLFAEEHTFEPYPRQQRRSVRGHEHAEPEPVYAATLSLTPSGTGSGGLALWRNSTVVNSRSVSPTFSTLWSMYSPGP